MSSVDVGPDAPESPETPGRSTRQKRAVSEALDATSDFRSAQEIHAWLGANGHKVGLATVYRTLQAFVDAGLVDVVKSDAGEAAYRRCSTTHHHHLVCRSCGHTVEIEGPTVEQWADSVAARHGFAEVSHTVELFGLCADCQARAARS